MACHYFSDFLLTIYIHAHVPKKQVLTVCLIGADVSKGLDMGPCFLARFDSEEAVLHWKINLESESARVSKSSNFPSLSNDDDTQTDMESESESDASPKSVIFAEAWDLQSLLIVQKLNLVIMGSSSPGHSAFKSLFCYNV